MPVVHFEDETYQLEKDDALVSFDLFLRVLNSFFESHDDVLALDANHELDGYFKQQAELEKNMADDNFDPFVQELQAQIDHYEQMLGVNQPIQEYPPLH